MVLKLIVIIINRIASHLEKKNPKDNKTTHTHTERNGICTRRGDATHQLDRQESDMHENTTKYSSR